MLHPAPRLDVSERHRVAYALCVDSIVRKVFGIMPVCEWGTAHALCACRHLALDDIFKRNWTSFCRNTSETLFNFPNRSNHWCWRTFPLLSTLTSIVNNGFHLYVLLDAVPKQYGNLRQRWAHRYEKHSYRDWSNASHILTGAKHLVSSLDYRYCSCTLWIRSTKSYPQCVRRSRLCSRVHETFHDTIFRRTCPCTFDLVHA